MQVNSVNILTKFGTIITGRDIQASDIISYTNWLENSLSPLKLKEEKFKSSSIGIKLLIEGISEEEILSKISEIIFDCKGGILKFSDIDYSYNIILDSHNSKLISDKAYELELQLKSNYKLKPLITETINRITNKTINVPGNLKTPCILEITPSIDIIDITLEGLAEDPIIIRNLKGGKTVILDGELQKITVDGINKYGDTDMWDFPSLQPGANALKFSRNNCDIKIKYKPRFL